MRYQSSSGGIRPEDIIYHIDLLKSAVEAMHNSATELDYRIFSGKTIGQHLNYQDAAITALANAVKLIMENTNGHV